MENQNSVCFVARINEIKPIEGADNIELAVIGGWNCIIKKDSYKVDDLVVVATTDAVIPQGLSDSMNVTNYLRKGQRVRTVKLRGIYSECLVIPNQFLPVSYINNNPILEGTDLMETLKIFKYEPPAVQIQLTSGRKLKYYQNQNFGIYYKFPNSKNVKGMFNEEDVVEVSRKIHGTNARYGIVKKSKLSIWDKVKLKLNSVLGIGGDSWKYCDFEFVIGSHNVVKDIQDL
jgi:RNA ligase (TIGR02306 family)